MSHIGSSWVAYNDQGLTNQQLTMMLHQGAGILRGIVVVDGNGGATPPAMNVFDATMLAQTLTAPGVVPTLGRPLFFGGGSSSGGVPAITGLSLFFFDGLVVSFRSAQTLTVLLVYDPA